MFIKYDMSMCLCVSDPVNLICSGLSYIDSNPFLVVGFANLRGQLKNKNISFKPFSGQECQNCLGFRAGL